MSNLEYGNLFIASGTFGTDGLGKGINPYLLTSITGIVLKTGTPFPMTGTTGRRLHFLSNGLINNIGLENPGISSILDNYLPIWADLTNVVISVSSSTLPGWSLIGKTLEKYDGIFAVELNVSCPNVPKEWKTVDAIKRFREEYSKEMWIKLSPQTVLLPKQLIELEVDKPSALTVSNSWYTESYELKGGMSGPIIREPNKKLVSKMKTLTDIPIIACGGIRSVEHAMEYLDLGATAVQVGEANILDPYVSCVIASKLNNLLSNKE